MCRLPSHDGDRITGPLRWHVTVLEGSGDCDLARTARPPAVIHSRTCAAPGRRAGCRHCCAGPAARSAPGRRSTAGTRGRRCAPPLAWWRREPPPASRPPCSSHTPAVEEIHCPSQGAAISVYTLIHDPVQQCRRYNQRRFGILHDHTETTHFETQKFDEDMSRSILQQLNIQANYDLCTDTILNTGPSQAVRAYVRHVATSSWWRWSVLPITTTYLVGLFDVDGAGIALHYGADVAAVGQVGSANLRARQMLQIFKVNLNEQRKETVTHTTQKELPIAIKRST